MLLRVMLTITGHPGLDKMIDIVQCQGHAVKAICCMALAAHSLALKAISLQLVMQGDLTCD